MSTSALSTPYDSDPVTRAPSPNAVRAQLERIVGSSAFEASERNRRFLRHVVEETLAGQVDRIKAYSIATSVFGRESDFDPQIDPIVRIEASRLRRALEHYYLTAGSQDPVRIEMVKGTYVPRFAARMDLEKASRERPPSEAMAGSKPRGGAAAVLGTVPLWLHRLSGRDLLAAFAIAAAFLLGLAWLISHPPASHQARKDLSRRGPALFVRQFDAGSAGAALLAPGFTRDVIAGLTRFQDLFVFGPDTSFAVGENGGVERLSAVADFNFILSGGITATADRFRVTSLLQEARTGRYVWSDSLDAQLTARDLLRAQEEIANRLVRQLADVSGALFNRKALEIASKPPRQLNSYECVVRYRMFWRQFDPQQLEAARECLERTVSTDPGYADGNAALALIIVDALRIKTGPQPDSQAQLDRALQLAKRAVELAPNAAFGYQALQNVHWLRGELESSLAAGRRAVELNPHNSEALAELGWRLTMQNDWGKGLPLLQEAYARNPLQPGGGRQMLALRLYMDGRYQDALAEVQRIDLPNFVYPQVLLAMVQAKLGHKREADAAVKRILELNPRFATEMTADLERRHLHPDLIHVIGKGLRDADLQVALPSSTSQSDMSRSKGRAVDAPGK